MYICSVLQVNCLSRKYPNIDTMEEDLQQLQLQRQESQQQLRETQRQLTQSLQGNAVL